MTNAVDVLLVGGLCDGMMECVNRANGVPATIDAQVPGEEYTLPYAMTKFWNDVDDRWYWIALYDQDATEEQIIYAIAFHAFQPAWDLRDLPAPQPEN